MLVVGIYKETAKDRRENILASNDKTFYIYFKDNMNATPFIACPETLFGQFSAAVGTISAMANYVKTYGNSATVAEMLLTIGGSAAAAGSGGVGAATVTAELGVAIVELGAAYYVGACIGSLFVAAVKSSSDLYMRAAVAHRSTDKPVFNKVHDISRFAKQNNIEISSEVQKVLHRYPQLRQCH